MLLSAPSRVFAATAAPLAAGPDVRSFERVVLDTAVLGFGDFDVELGGRTHPGHRVASERRDDGETFEFQIGEGPRPLSVMTTFYDRAALAHVIVDGVSYFISPEGDHYVIAPASARMIEDTVQYPVPASSVVVTDAAGVTKKRRAVAPCCRQLRAVYQGVIATSYLDAIGSEQAARDRFQHVIDYTNTALKNSGFNDGVIAVNAPLVRNFGATEATSITDQIVADAEIQSVRKGVRGCGIIALSQKGPNVAVRNFPGTGHPASTYAVGGAFFASWDDGDMQALAHEIGHTLGMDHNAEDVFSAMKDPQPYARAWYDCGRKARDLMSYNRCGDALQMVPLYSGLAAVWQGVTLGEADTRDNIRAARNVFPGLDQSRINE